MPYKKFLKKDNEQTLGEALKLMLNSYKLDEKLLATKAELCWEKLMGAGVLTYTKKVWVEKRVLFVQLSSEELKQELHYGRTKLVKMINEELDFDYIKEVKFL